MKKMFLVGACLLVGSLQVYAETLDCRPETWFHIIGGNASKSGLTADLKAIRDAGFGGIQFFHGQFVDVAAWDGVTEQIPCLSEKWDELVRHVASECKRLGLQFKMQNCPGWSADRGLLLQTQCANLHFPGWMFHREACAIS